MKNRNVLNRTEYSFLRKALQGIPRSKSQLNKFNESDCEVLKIAKNLFFCTSTDSLSEEVAINLYKHPETWGWISVMNSISDFSTSGAKPIGLMLSTEWGQSFSEKDKLKFYSGVKQALRVSKVPLLGGDSGVSSGTFINTTVFGMSHSPVLTRLGVQPDDLIILLGDYFGIGPSLGYDFLFKKNKNTLEKKFRPKPNCKILQALKKYVHASIDTSDGVITSLEIISNLNKVSYELNLQKISVCKAIASYVKKNKLSMNYLLSSDLGDLQTLIFVAPKDYSLIKNKLGFHQITGEVKNKNYKSTFDKTLFYELIQPQPDYKKIHSDYIHSC
jgi:thiamine-monophosphate kinase